MVTSAVAVITFNAVPEINLSYKYDLLGPLAVENHRRYCARHGYDFISDMPPADGRPFCWAKIPAILSAFETHEWVLWADSDTLVREDAAPLELYPRSPELSAGHARYVTETPEGEAVTIDLDATACKDAPLTAEVTIGARKLNGCAQPR